MTSITASPKGFHASIPRKVRVEYKQLTHAEKWLYVCLKDLCGDKGVCFRTLPCLSEETDISVASLKTMIPHLHDAGLIVAEKKGRVNGGKALYYISIVNIWSENQKAYPVPNSQNLAIATQEEESNSQNLAVKGQNLAIASRSNSQNLAIGNSQNLATEGEVCNKETITKEITEGEEERAALAAALTTDTQSQENHITETSTKPAPTQTKPSFPAKRPVSQQEASKRASAKETGQPQKNKKADIDLTLQEKLFWSLWMQIDQHSKVKPKLTKTASEHVAALAPYVTTQEELDSLVKHTREKLREKTGKPDLWMVELGNLRTHFPDWDMKRQGKQNGHTPGSSLGQYKHLPPIPQGFKSVKKQPVPIGGK